MKRREILQHLGALPIAGSLLTRESLIHPHNMESISKTLANEGNIYNSLGVDTIINCRGTFTILGGSTERPEVIQAIEAASGYFVQYDELANGIGKRLAEITKTDWGIVTAGCAAALKHVTAACVTGGNPEKLIRIPNLEGFEKTEVIIPRHSRNVYDHAVRNVGITVVMVDSPEELERAINPKTAMIYITTGRASDTGQPLSLEVIAGIAKPHNVPILVDAAAENLTLPPVHLARGGTIVAYSGGKAICGPQCAGLAVGDKSILMSAWQASSPHHGPGRDNKVGKEEMLGMLAAVEAWTTRDHEAEWKQWLVWLDTISTRLEQIKGISTEVTEPQGLNNRAPVLHVRWDSDELHITGAEVAEEVARKKQRIAIGSRDKDGMTSINITPNQMRPGNAEVVAERLFGILSQKRQPDNKAMQAAAVDLTGHWDVEVSFFNSKSMHTFYIDQDGNWMEGSHLTDFHTLDLKGMIEGDEVKMRSDFHIPGNHLNYMFSGEAKEDSITGSIFLGEYLTATFEAKRRDLTSPKKPIVIPGGPPLAT